MNTLIIIIAQYAIILIPILVIVAFMKTQPLDKRQFIITFIVGCIVGYLLLLLASHSLYDPRPFTVPGVVPLFHHAPDNGFPSDHTTSSALAAFLVFIFSRRIGAIMILIAVLIGSARVFAHVHSWIDIIGGILIALVAAVTAYYIGRSIVHKAQD